MTEHPAPRTVCEERSLSPMRKTIANRLQQSYQEAVHVTVTRNVDAGTLLAAVDAASSEDDDNDAVDPSILDVILRTLSETLEEHPSFNATFEDGTHYSYEQHNIGVAVAIDGGLVTPVLADVGSKSLKEIAQERRRLTGQVKDGDYSMSTFEGGTITVSNLGPLGVDFFTPVINPPEVAILGVGRVTEMMIPNNDGTMRRDQISLSMSFDHRVVDGADAARFLETLVNHLNSATKYTG